MSRSFRIEYPGAFYHVTAREREKEKQIGVTSSDVIFAFEYPSLTNAFGNGKAHRVSWAFLSLFAWLTWRHWWVSHGL
jgi:hypothetical protein